MTFSSIPIGELADVFSGGGAPQDETAFSDSGHPFVRAGSLIKLLDGADEASLERIQPEAAKEHSLRLFPEGTVLFAKSGMSATKGHIYRLKRPAYVVNHLAALVSREARDSAFLVRALQKFSPTSLIKDPAYPSVRLGDIEAFKIKAPSSVEERGKIAAILDAADALRTKRRITIRTIDSLAQSIFSELVHDADSSNWPQCKLTEVFDFRTGKLDSNAAEPEGKYPFFTCSKEDFRINTYAFDCEALLLAGNNASADYSVKYYKGKFNAYQRTYVLTLKDPNNKYEYARVALERKLFDLKRLSKGTNTKYLTMGIFNDQKITVPPTSKQNEFAVRLRLVENLRSRHVTSLAELSKLFFSLQNRAFRGLL